MWKSYKNNPICSVVPVICLCRGYSVASGREQKPGLCLCSCLSSALPVPSQYPRSAQPSPRFPGLENTESCQDSSKESCSWCIQPDLLRYHFLNFISIVFPWCWIFTFITLSCGFAASEHYWCGSQLQTQDLHHYFMFNKTGAPDFAVINTLLSFVPLPFSLFFLVFFCCPRVCGILQFLHLKGIWCWWVCTYALKVL